jgi:site-specific recombinase XerD
LQVNLQVRQNKTKAIKETIMNLSPAYEEWHKKTIAEGAALAQQAFEQTRQTIIAEGEARGEAKAAEKVRRSLAQKMLQEGASVEFVAKVTGFSPAEIAALG